MYEKMVDENSPYIGFNKYHRLVKGIGTDCMGGSLSDPREFHE